MVGELIAPAAQRQRSWLAPLHAKKRRAGRLALLHAKRFDCKAGFEWRVSHVSSMSPSLRGLAALMQHWLGRWHWRW